MKKLTDFELAAVGSGIAVIADIHWLIQDYVHAGRLDHIGTSVGLTISFVYIVWSVIRHKKTGAKLVQSADDIDYRVQLSLLRNNFKRYCVLEQSIQAKSAFKERRARHLPTKRIS